MKTKKIKIALFSDVLKENLDGVTYTLYNIIKRIPADTFDFLFITPYPPEDIENFPYPVHVCKYVRFPLYKDYPLAMPDFDPDLETVLDRFNPDIIHFTTPALLGRYAVKYARARNIPISSTYHTHFKSYVDYYFKYLPGIKHLLHRLVNRIMLWFYNQCSIIFVPTQPIMDELITIGIDEERLMVWGRGIDSHAFSPSHRDTAYIEELAGTDTKKALFVSRLVWEKEIQTLIKIYELLKKNNTDITMVITGEGPQKNYMMKKMPCAVFTGKLCGDALARIYASCDIFIFPSVTETFGNVILEAMASGLPVVAAAQGGPKGIIRDGETGFLVEPKNPDAFYHKILTIRNEPLLREKMSHSARSYAQQQTWDNLCNILFDTYDMIAHDALQEKKIENDYVAV